MQTSSRSERLAIRIAPQVKERLLIAAETRHKTLSEFVLDTVVSEAETILAEKQLFSLSDQAWDKFQTALDAPPQAPTGRLKQLLTEPSVFDV